MKKTKLPFLPFFKFLPILPFAAVFFACSALFFPAQTAHAKTFEFHNSSDVPGLVTLYEDSAPVWSFQTTQRTHDWVAENDARRTSGGYFHPIFGLDGEILTTNASTYDNHQHHHGLWTSFFTLDVQNEDGTFTHYDTWTDDTAVKKDLIAFQTSAENPHGAALHAESAWFLYENGTKQAPLVTESLDCVTHPTETTPELGRSRAIDLSYIWKNVSGRKITLAGDRPNGKNFCALAIRFAKPFESVRISGPNGEIVGDPLRCDVSWVDYTTAFQLPDGTQKRLGLTILSDPSNPRDGSGMAIRHYGMLVTGWPGVEGVTLEDGESRTLKYRVWIHDETSFEKLKKHNDVWASENQGK